MTIEIFKNPKSENIATDSLVKTNGASSSNNSIVPLTQTSKQEWLSSFFGKIGRQLEDLTYLEVLTTGADTSKLRLTDEHPEIDDALKASGEMTILARTRIELDGDITVLLPLKNNAEDTSINNEVLDIHKENVKMAIENWHSFLNTAIEAAKTIAYIAGYKDVGKAFDKFMFNK